MIAWQRTIPLYLDSTLHDPQQVVLHRSAERGEELIAAWGDHGLGVNQLLLFWSTEVVRAAALTQAAQDLLASIEHLHGMTACGHAYYFENTQDLASELDANGLRAGQVHEVVNAEGQPVWDLCTYDNGVYTPVGLRRVAGRTYAGETPPDTPHISWQRRTVVGEGKERQLDSARECAMWPQLTDEQLTSPDLEEILKPRMLELVAELHAFVSKYPALIW